MYLFPAPYPDELLYSMIARYHFRSDNKAPRVTMGELFGSKHYRPVIDLPGHLEEFCKTLNERFSPDLLIEKHTLYPYYAPFLSDNKKKALLEAMKFGNSTTHSIIGNSILNFKEIRALYVCPICIEQDMERYGEPYWHRVHQIPCVSVCPEHLVKLYRDCPICKVPLRDGRIDNLQITPTHCTNGHSLSIVEKSDHSIMTQLSLDSSNILNEYYYDYSIVNNREIFINNLLNRKIYTNDRFLPTQIILERLIKWATPSLLHKLGIVANSTKMSHWVSRTLKGVYPSPLHNLLVMIFLAGSVGSFLEASVYKPFGDGPWPCLNAASDHYGETVISTVELTKRHNGNDPSRPIGMFKCSCGFEYSRVGPDKDESDMLKYTRIPKVGRLWAEKVENLYYIQRLSIPKIAQKMKVSRKIIDRFLAELKERIANPTSENVFEKAKESKRQLLLTALRINPSLTRGVFQRVDCNTYYWLRKYDRDWLLSMLPNAKWERPDYSRKPEKTVLDKKDQELSEKILAAIQEIKSRDGKPIRASFSEISRSFRVGSIRSLTKNLPKCKEVLSNYTESIDDYNIRKIEWTIATMDSGMKVTTYKVLYRVSLHQNPPQHLMDYVMKRLSEVNICISDYISPEVQDEDRFSRLIESKGNATLFDELTNVFAEVAITKIPD